MMMGTFVSVYDHLGIEGNDRADNLAREGTSDRLGFPLVEINGNKLDEINSDTLSVCVSRKV